jgi:hypothetical protein
MQRMQQRPGSITAGNPEISWPQSRTAISQPLRFNQKIGQLGILPPWTRDVYSLCNLSTSQFSSRWAKYIRIAAIIDRNQPNLSKSVNR